MAKNQNVLDKLLDAVKRSSEPEKVEVATEVQTPVKVDILPNTVYDVVPSGLRTYDMVEIRYNLETGEAKVVEKYPLGDKVLGKVTIDGKHNFKRIIKLNKRGK